VRLAVTAADAAAATAGNSGSFKQRGANPPQPHSASPFSSLDCIQDLSSLQGLTSPRVTTPRRLGSEKEREREKSTGKHSGLRNVEIPGGEFRQDTILCGDVTNIIIREALADFLRPARGVRIRGVATLESSVSRHVWLIPLCDPILNIVPLSIGRRG